MQKCLPYDAPTLCLALDLHTRAVRIRRRQSCDCRLRTIRGVLGAASCSIIDKKLYSIFFLATELYYYKKYNGEFENILSSIEKVSKKKNKS